MGSAETLPRCYAFYRQSQSTPSTLFFGVHDESSHIPNGYSTPHSPSLPRARQGADRDPTQVHGTQSTTAPSPGSANVTTTTTAIPNTDLTTKRRDTAISISSIGKAGQVAKKAARRSWSSSIGFIRQCQSYSASNDNNEKAKHRAKPDSPFSSSPNAVLTPTQSPSSWLDANGEREEFIPLSLTLSLTHEPFTILGQEISRPASQSPPPTVFASVEWDKTWRGGSSSGNISNSTHQRGWEQEGKSPGAGPSCSSAKYRAGGVNGSNTALAGDEIHTDTMGAVIPATAFISGETTQSVGSSSTSTAMQPLMPASALKRVPKAPLRKELDIEVLTEKLEAEAEAQRKRKGVRKRLWRLLGLRRKE